MIKSTCKPQAMTTKSKNRPLKIPLVVRHGAACLWPGVHLERFSFDLKVRKGVNYGNHIYKRGQTYWLKYYRNGKPYYDSTGTAKETDVKKLLKKRKGEISEGKLPGVYFDRVRFDELAEDFLAD
jgi:hypothetical protein